MRYVRTSFKMGGTPSGIETLTPRKKFQFGTPEFNFLERSLQNELRAQNEMDQFKKQNTTFNKLLRRFPRLFPLSLYGTAAGVGTGIGALTDYFAKSTYTPEGYKRLKEMGGPNYPFDETASEEDILAAQKYIDEGNLIGEAPGFLPPGGKKKFFKDRGLDEETGLPLEGDFETEGRAAKVLPGETALDAVLREGKVISEKRAKETGKGDEGDADPSKDTDPGGDEKEFSFENEFERQVKRVEKYLGKDDVDKGEIAIALSEAVGTPGTLADKAANLNKFLLKKAAGKRKDKRDIAKLAFAAATELEGKMIDAGKLSQREKDRQRYVALARKDNLSEDEKLELKALEGQLRLDSGTFSPSAGITFGAAIDDIKSKLRQFTDKNTSEEDKVVIRDRIKSAITGLNSAGISDNRILAALSDYPTASQFFSEGGRVKKAMGGPTETPAEPVDTKLTFEQLRTRLPKEITDDIVRLVATSEEALQDFAYIRTQGDVEKFNVKYGVNLVLPQNTA